MLNPLSNSTSINMLASAATKELENINKLSQNLPLPLSPILSRSNSNSNQTSTSSSASLAYVKSLPSLSTYFQPSQPHSLPSIDRISEMTTLPPPLSLPSLPSFKSPSSVASLSFAVPPSSTFHQQTPLTTSIPNSPLHSPPQSPHSPQLPQHTQHTQLSPQIHPLPAEKNTTALPPLSSILNNP
ncbi:unnamed protein product [Pichia kudriavzevii]